LTASKNQTRRAPASIPHALVFGNLLAVCVRDHLCLVEIFAGKGSAITVPMVSLGPAALHEPHTEPPRPLRIFAAVLQSHLHKRPMLCLAPLSRRLWRRQRPDRPASNRRAKAPAPRLADFGVDQEPLGVRGGWGCAFRQAVRGDVGGRSSAGLRGAARLRPGLQDVCPKPLSARSSPWRPCSSSCESSVPCRSPAPPNHGLERPLALAPCSERSSPSCSISSVGPREHLASVCVAARGGPAAPAPSGPPSGMPSRRPARSPPLTRSPSGRCAVFHRLEPFTPGAHSAPVCERGRRGQEDAQMRTEPPRKTLLERRWRTIAATARSGPPRGQRRDHLQVAVSCAPPLESV